jgi:hypothetical protein
MIQRLSAAEQSLGQCGDFLSSNYIAVVLGLLKSDDKKLSTGMMDAICSFPRGANLITVDIKPIVRDLVQYIKANTMQVDVAITVLAGFLKSATDGDEEQTGILRRYLSVLPGRAEALPNLLPVISRGDLGQCLDATYLMVSL